MKAHWTNEVPKKAGWYWWKRSGKGNHPHVVVHIFYDAYSRAMRVDTVTGREPEPGVWWSEPIQEPEAEAAEVSERE